MRVYIPALSDELSGEQPVVRPGWVALIPAGTHPEQCEVYEDDAVTEAALDGLSLLRDTEPPATGTRAMRRLVLALDVPTSDVTVSDEEPADEEGIICPATIRTATWSHVQAIMLDDAEAQDAVRAVLDATTQDEADQAISDLWEYAIGWFDISERSSLARALASTFTPKSLRQRPRA